MAKATNPKYPNKIGHFGPWKMTTYLVFYDYGVLENGPFLTRKRCAPNHPNNTTDGCMHQITYYRRCR